MVIAYDFNRRACDGRELELSEINVIHVPDSDSPQRESVRRKMIDIVQDSFAGPEPDGLPELRTDETLDEWAARVVTKWKSQPEATRIAKGYPATAAHILVGIGDMIAVSHISRWLTEYPERAGNLFRSYLFDTYCYEIVPPGVRRDLILGPASCLVEGPPPLTASRRDPIEVFRPISGNCEVCGERLLALFDVLVNSVSMPELPAAQRLCLPLCPHCCEGMSGFASVLRIDDPDDRDAWPSREAEKSKHGVPSRRFRQISTSEVDSTVAASFGGKPRWEQDPSWPSCQACHKRMIFAGQAVHQSVIHTLDSSAQTAGQATSVRNGIEGARSQEAAPATPTLGEVT